MAFGALGVVYEMHGKSKCATSVIQEIQTLFHAQVRKKGLPLTVQFVLYRLLHLEDAAIVSRIDAY